MARSGWYWPRNLAYDGRMIHVDTWMHYVRRDGVSACRYWYAWPVDESRFFVGDAKAALEGNPTLCRKCLHEVGGLR